MVSLQMRFKAHSVTEQQFNEWVAAVKAGNGTTINPEAVQKLRLTKLNWQPYVMAIVLSTKSSI